METNYRETIDFIVSLPSKYLITSLILLILYLLALLNYKKIIVNLNITVILFSVACLALPSAIDASITTKDKIKPIYDEYQALFSNGSVPTWSITKNFHKNKTYVVIVGEAMRKDFMSLYGFDYKTTPFIDDLPKKYITEFVSTAINTTLSVPRYLAISDKDGQIDEGNNAVTLAQAAGFDTYWISSQGFTSKYNISSSRIAKYANHKYFTKKYDDDDKLLPRAKRALRKPGKKVVFIHTMGAHENPCNRLHNHPIRYDLGKGKMLDCYLSAYHKIDEFVAKVHGYLVSGGQDYAMVFFSDHGLNIVRDGNVFKTKRNDEVKASYEVPFFVTSNDSIASERIDVVRSGFNFMNFFANWIGVETTLTESDYDIFRSRNDDPRVMAYDKELYKYNELMHGLGSNEIMQDVLMLTDDLR